jgi:hypothetical protein
MSIGLPLRASITCPHCWTMFHPGEVLWVSKDPSLHGDPVLGADEQLRFLPTRFTVEGLAIDVNGATCTKLACPKCHLIIPRILLQTESLFLSIVGSPSSGKSNLLAGMAWYAPRLLERFGVNFIDADTGLNQALSRLYRHTLPELE